MFLTNALVLILSARISTSVLFQIPDCTSYSISGQCLKCADQFELDSSSNLCIGSNRQPRFLATNNTNTPNCTIAHCQDCSTNSTNSSMLICVQCFPGFIMSSGSCVCPSMKTLYNSQCVQCNITGCKLCTSSNNCSSCNPNLILNSQHNYCLSCTISNCAECSSDNICRSCQNGLTPNPTGDQCIDCGLTNCKVCESSTGSRCISCKSGFQFGTDNNTCLSCNVIGCQKCSANNICETCLSGYEKNINNENCFVCSAPCETCNADSSCLTCRQPLYSLHPSNTTKNCYTCEVKSCQICQESSPQTCVTCMTGYSLTSGNCQKICNVSNCQTCNPSSGVCTVCNQFYVLQGTACNSCPQVPKCKQCSSPNGGSCTMCTDGFYLQSGQCMPCKKECMTCANGNTCASLTDSIGKTLTANGMGVAICSQGCASCSSSNAELCLQCLKGFSLKEGVCYPCAYPCDTCTDGAPASCLSCLQGTHLSGTNCLRCNAQCNTCRSTDVNYCESCPLDFSLKSGRCNVTCSQNCEDCQSISLCTSCSKGYTVNITGYCMPCLADCKRCSGTIVSICLECGDGLALKLDGSCTTCPESCIMCVVADGMTVCKQCVDGYHVGRGFTCEIDCMPPCASCVANNARSCQSCVAGYGYNSAELSCSPVFTCTGGCKYCPEGWILSQGSCKACTGICARCKDVAPSICTSCSYSYYLEYTNSTCIACPNGCQTCNNANYCRSCVNGYTLLNTPVPSVRSCVACIAPCKTCYQRSDRCTSCTAQYYLRGWRCITQYNFGFALVFNVQFRNFFTQYVVFLYYIKTACGLNALRYVAMVSIVSGSASLSGFVSQDADPSTPEGAQAIRNSHAGLQQAIQSGVNIGGLQVLSSNIVVNGGQLPPDNSAAAGENANLALILGIVIPVGVIIILGVIGFLLYQKHRRGQVLSNDAQHNDHKPLGDSYEETHMHTQQGMQNTTVKF